MSYKSTRRQWVKLWVNEWLDGTTRFELTAPQRLLWIDLLALAGRSRFPGFVYAGTGRDGNKLGYPIAYLAGVLQMDEVALNNALRLLKEHEHITLDETAPESYVIGIINWEKYQSEYLRQKTYRKVTSIVTNDSTSRLPVEGEKKEKRGRVEVEVEEKDAAAAFRSIGFTAPFGHANFQAIWWDEWLNPKGRWVTEMMEATIQRCQEDKIKVPPQFYDAKRDVEIRENAQVKKRVPL
jgi:hypothetical protein